MFIVVIGVVRPVDVEATASGNVARSERLVALTRALLGRGSGATISVGTATAGMVFARVACSMMSVIKDGAKSASLNTAGLNGHSPQLENHDTALSIVQALVYAAPKRAAMLYQVIRFPVLLVIQ